MNRETREKIRQSNSLDVVSIAICTGLIMIVVGLLISWLGATLAWVLGIIVFITIAICAITRVWLIIDRNI